jgi:hypothetical protein
MRCRYAKDRCKIERPQLREVRPGHYSACHFAEELELRGVEPVQAVVKGEGTGKSEQGKGTSLTLNS